MSETNLSIVQSNISLENIIEKQNIIAPNNATDSQETFNSTSSLPDVIDIDTSEILYKELF